ncbi:NERD domain-containing protein [Thermomicrobium sp.]
MATMYPQFPRYCSFQSDAERLVYSALAHQLPDACLVLFAVRLLVRDGSDEIDAEADFIIVEPQCGVLVLEVKGGGIRRDARTGQWYSLDRRGDEHPIGNPIEQARRTRYALARKLKEGPRTKLFDYPIRHAVIFPDVTLRQQWLGPDVEPDIVLDDRSLTGLHGAIRRALGGPRPEGPLAPAAIQALVDALSPTIEVRKPRLGRLVQEAEEEIVQLTERQFAVLRLLERHRRARIVGPAGSGKTMLAIEKARQLALQGNRVLLTCFNRNLSRWMRRTLTDALKTTELFEGDRPLLVVTHFHGFVRELCERTGTPFQPPAGDPREVERFWKEQAPQILIDSLEQLPELRFDAIIVDEGQDFLTDWWIALLEAMADQEQGLLYIFYDDNQTLYTDSRQLEFPIVEEPYVLAEVFRNTRPIFERFRPFYRGSIEPVFRGPDGPEVEEVPVTAQSLLQTLSNRLRRLLEEEGIEPRDVVILTPRSRERSALRDKTWIAGRWQLTWETDDREQANHRVRVSSIHAFKGLESPVVILAEVDDLARQRVDELSYVALSRARSHLIVLGQLPVELDF